MEVFVLKVIKDIRESEKMKFSKKWIWPLLLLIWPYVLNLVNYIENENIQTIILYLYFFFTIVVYVGNIINAFRYKKDNDMYELAFINMILKIVHIPFYLSIFLIGLVFLFASVVPALVFITPMILFYLFMIDILLMITTSMYGVNVIKKAVQSHVVTKKKAIIHLILHFIFVTDVISSIYLFIKVRKYNKKY